MMTHSESIKNIAGKLVNVIAAMGYVKKNGRNTFQNYTYATESDVADKAREAFVAQRLCLVPCVIDRTYYEKTTVKGSIELIARVTIQYTIIDADSGEWVTTEMVGDGQDAGDKGIYKAITGCQKYFYAKLGLISTGDDPEEDGKDEKADKGQASTTKQAQDLAVLAGQAALKAKREAVKSVPPEAIPQAQPVPRPQDAPLASEKPFLVGIGGTWQPRRDTNKGTPPGKLTVEVQDGSEVILDVWDNHIIEQGPKGVLCAFTYTLGREFRGKVPFVLESIDACQEAELPPPIDMGQAYRQAIMQAETSAKLNAIMGEIDNDMLLTDAEAKNLYDVASKRIFSLA